MKKVKEIQNKIEEDVKNKIMITLINLMKIHKYLDGKDVRKIFYIWNGLYF